MHHGSCSKIQYLCPPFTSVKAGYGWVLHRNGRVAMLTGLSSLKALEAVGWQPSMPSVMMKMSTWQPFHLRVWVRWNTSACGSLVLFVVNDSHWIASADGIQNSSQFPKMIHVSRQSLVAMFPYMWLDIVPVSHMDPPTLGSHAPPLQTLTGCFTYRFGINV